MTKTLLTILLAALLLALAAGPASAQTAGADDSVLVRVNGDVAVAAGDELGVVVVVQGDLDFAGTAETVVVVDGSADLDGATVDTLVVVSGSADLGPDTTISGDVRLIDSTITQDDSATIEGEITKGVGNEFFAGFWIIGLLLMIGWAVLVLAAGLLMAAVAPGLAREAARTMTTDLGPTIIAGLVLWILVPILGILLFATIIGTPTALAVWLIVLPALGFVGFLVSGLRLGEYIINRDRPAVGHPYLASIVGLGALIIIGAIPIVGPLVVTVAGFLGSGALALQAWRAMRAQPEPVTGPAAPTPASATE